MDLILHNCLKNLTGVSLEWANLIKHGIVTRLKISSKRTPVLVVSYFQYALFAEGDRETPIDHVTVKCAESVGKFQPRNYEAGPPLEWSECWIISNVYELTP